MKTLPTFTNFYKTILGLSLLVSLNGFSQNTTTNNGRVTTLQNVVEDIKSKNEVLKNADHVNVMVNDVLVEDLKDFTIDPKSIALVEVLDLNPKSGGNERIKSIIINTKKF